MLCFRSRWWAGRIQFPGASGDFQGWGRGGGSNSESGLWKQHSIGSGDWGEGLLQRPTCCKGTGSCNGCQDGAQREGGPDPSPAPHCPFGSALHGSPWEQAAQKPQGKPASAFPILPASGPPSTGLCAIKPCSCHPLAYGKARPLASHDPPEGQV